MNFLLDETLLFKSLKFFINYIIVAINIPFHFEKEKHASNTKLENTLQHTN